MATALLHGGFSIETDLILQKLRIDGRLMTIKKEGEIYVYVELPEIQANTLDELGRKIIDHSPEFRPCINKIRNDHVAILSQGIKVWNAWRKSHPAIRPLLYEVDLQADLNGRSLSPEEGEEPADFSFANLVQAKLMRANLIKANFHEANLANANLAGADLTEANFCRTDLYETILSGAILHGANLQGTQLARTDFQDAQLINCTIYGLSAWDLKLKGATQHALNIIYKKEIESGVWEESHFQVPDLETAQFIYMLLDNPKISNALDAIAANVVLILGRFTSERKAILDAIRDALPDHGYAPIVFDFDQPRSTDITHTVTLLAQMSHFVIVDLTEPSSSPHELKTIYDHTSAPIQTIILNRHKPFSLFWDAIGESPLRVLPPFVYNDLPHLIESLEEAVISPSKAAAVALSKQRERAKRDQAAFEEQAEKPTVNAFKRI